MLRVIGPEVDHDLGSCPGAVGVAVVVFSVSHAAKDCSLGLGGSGNVYQGCVKNPKPTVL